MSDESYFSEPFKFCKKVKTPAETTQQICLRLAHFSVDLTCTILKWMNVCRINFAYVVMAWLLVLSPEGNLQQAKLSYFSTLKRNSFSVKSLKAYINDNCSVVTCGKRDFER